MASKQEVFRERVVSFYMSNKEKGLPFTVEHFRAENRPERTIRSIIQRFKERQTTERKVGTGKKLNIMTKEQIRNLYRLVNHSDKWNYSSAARKFGCDPKTIKYWLTKRDIKQYIKKSPMYSETQKEMVRRQCGWLYRKYKNKDFVIDDEKYFTLSHSSNNTFLSSPTKSKTPEEVAHNFKTKFEPKVLLWIAISKHGISEAYIRPNRSGFSINKNNYLKECQIIINHQKTVNAIH